MNTDGTGFHTCKECHKTEYLWNHNTTDHNEREQLEDRRSVGASSCNCGDGTDQRVQSYMFMMMTVLTPCIPGISSSFLMISLLEEGIFFQVKTQLSYDVFIIVLTPCFGLDKRSSSGHRTYIWVYYTVWFIKCIVSAYRRGKWFVLLTQYCAGDKIEKNEMSWACGAYGWGEGVV